MHPQLQAQRFHSCLDLIQALDKCHQAEFYKKAFGYCNNEKEELSKCLHEARLADQKDNILKNKEKRKMIDQKWKQIEEEEFGEDAILKKIIQRHAAKQNPKSSSTD
ncbi:Cmc2p Ecym_4693 [Eremothecium cymbalariae DBVPG|uniref:COX assembly mitochondrial protein n=1 Tax=Eremothecium cymbalariae (strain CBS 270.75 / DBVPG 7215 / KCTC 17166 / NRRL Y-17582) TaxID=931890 RepID=G8JSJ2_ERECY|nr:hypothetical protein Ecym_4693 [Eremothecium cymbalariae DBVPG\